MFNLLKQYNDFLDVDMMSPNDRKTSLRRVFDRDIQNNPTFAFREKKIYPIPKDGMDKIEILFTHLTTKVTDKSTMHREYDRERSIRLHWINYHIREQKKNDMLIFSTLNGREKRTYIYDKAEKYVIVLEPKEAKKCNDKGEPYIFKYYYFLTAYHLEGKDAKRDKFERLYLRRADTIL
jgi:hypothetical protein